jgi:hypothetical protein
VDDEPQSQEELDAHYGPSGPVEAARRWLVRVLEDHDLAGAWPSTDAKLRLMMTQAWTWANRSGLRLAPEDARRLGEELAGERGPDHLLWSSFADTQIREFQETWGDFDPDTWSVASRPRPTIFDHELVLFTDTAGAVMTFEEPTLIFAIGVVLRRTDSGWLVADFNPDPDAAPRSPQWPPAR